MKMHDLRADEISHHDGAVIDRDGSVWVYFPDKGKWAYIVQEDDESLVLSYDRYDFLMNSYGPYQRLDQAAVALIKKGLK